MLGVDVETLSDQELYDLSLQKNKKGRYTTEANAAYAERYRRSGIIQYGGVASRCSKYRADMDYYGGLEVSNR